MDLAAHVIRAERRIRKYIRETPLVHSVNLSGGGCQVYLKLENLQHTGSFKFRGAMNKLLTSETDDSGTRVIAASTGNHALAVARGMKLLGREGTIYLPESVSEQKLHRLRRYGVQLHFEGREPLEAEIRARKASEISGAVYISPYNDLQVVAGQGTIGVELKRSLSQIDYIFVSVGGGGLISGIGAYLKHAAPGVRVIGCVPANSPAMYDSVRAGRIVPARVLPTLSDGTAGQVEPQAITFELCRRLVDEWVIVDEDEIGRAIRLIYEKEGLVIEGAAGVSVTAFLRLKDRLCQPVPSRVVLVLCGGNIDSRTIRRLLL